MSMALLPKGMSRPLLVRGSWVLGLAGAMLATSAACTSSDANALAQTTDAADAPPGVLPPILDGGGGIPDAPNGASFCPTGACNYQSQTGCATEAGALLGCQPFPSGDAGILPTCATAGTKTANQSCTSWIECEPGLLCTAGSCLRMCCGDDYSACPEGESCFGSLLIQVGDAGVASGAMVCLAVGTCDVLTGKTCPTGQACHIVDPTGAVACVEEGMGKAGEDCPCASGFTCVAETCRRLCLAVEGGGYPWCPVEEGRCVHFDRDPPNVGECAPLAS
jgi:hypothetical protein